MFLRAVDLKNFRNYEQLQVQLDPGITLLLGANAAGKSSFLEALYMLATMSSPRAGADREVIRFGTQGEFGAPPMARLVAQVQRGDEVLHLVLMVQQFAADAQSGRSGQCRKAVRVNRRAVPTGKAVGQLQAVLFRPEDLALVTGSPARRRHYLDAILVQADRRYYEAYQRYQRVLAQRNSLLRQWRNGSEPVGSRDQMAYWNREMVRSGAYILLARKRLVAGMGPDLEHRHQELTGDNKAVFGLEYRSGVAFQATDDEESVGYAFRQTMHGVWSRERKLGQTLLGPHRDDLAFLLAGVDLAAYGSRGQQRTAVVALKLAEVEWLRRESNEIPVLLLDDVLSELDPQRRDYLQGWLLRGEGQQVIVTATDASELQPVVLAQAQVYQVVNGQWVKPEHESPDLGRPADVALTFALPGTVAGIGAEV